MKKLFVLPFVLMLLSMNSFADYRWERANLVDTQDTGDYSLKRCIYETYRGYRFAMIHRGYSCPYSVQINPETGQVKKGY
ncbi:MAG: hypothetical protein LKF82_00395 [Acinetobacter populi]|jgi:hypothetical protein|uniref:hypothetical protein n=1 Tax=Acinetobacter populi TaxID=1582270 RepID=UPI0023566684|nr:hypothetical protein [Acinetobacter populi]MCH4246288.1 hypothetical protein [Acinetobacter populi]